MMYQDSLEPAAIRFMLKRLQESARRSGYFLPAFFMHWLSFNYNFYYTEEHMVT